MESNNDVLNSDENCSCEENELENGDNKYPDYSYRKQPQFFYRKITDIRSKKYQCTLCISFGRNQTMIDITSKMQCFL